MQAPKHKACHDEWDEDCKIFVGGLGEEGTRIELEDSFQKFGPIKNIWLAKAPPSFAYIEMADPRDAEDAVKSLHRTEICGMRATVKMAREKEDERAQARDRMLREEMAKKKARMEAETARRGGSYRTRDDLEGSSGSSSHRDRDYGRGRNCTEEKNTGRDRRDDRRDHRDDRDRRDRDYRGDRDRRDHRDDRNRRDYRDDRRDRR